ncbi:hypothetical protein LIER_32813 [Lithospermum erythrorhizon]|uniref:Uncharacterized protein n=1 Tax=Lithospermum erythrorhizon TaxID=34254 RepID=A0AAV3RYB4_LITER
MSSREKRDSLSENPNRNLTLTLNPNHSSQRFPVIDVPTSNQAAPEAAKVAVDVPREKRGRRRRIRAGVERS